MLLDGSFPTDPRSSARVSPDSALASSLVDPEMPITLRRHPTVSPIIRARDVATRKRRLDLGRAVGLTRRSDDQWVGNLVPGVPGTSFVSDRSPGLPLLWGVSRSLP